MIILYVLGLMGLIGVLCVVVAICKRDYTKDEKGKDIEDKIGDYYLR